MPVAAAASPYRDEFHKTYPVSPNVQVSLSNINGSVQITTQNTAIPNGAFTIGGSTTLSGQLRVVVIGSNYTGPTDWNDMQQLIVSGQTTYQQQSSGVLISNGHWSATFNGMPEGTYYVYVYDSSGTTLAQEIFFSTYKG